jgi:DNA polymerase I-like protein with 3'-5' exonuclease and polymerase domains
MLRLFWIMLADHGIHQEDTALVFLLDGEKPEGAYQKITAGQLARQLPGFRERLEAVEADVLIPFGGDAFRAITGRKGKGWGIDSIAGYVLEPEDCKKPTFKTRVQIGTYKTSRKDKFKKGDPKYGMRDRQVPVALPQGCKYIVPCVTIQSLRKTRFKGLAAWQAACEHAKAVRELGVGQLSDVPYVDAVPPRGLDWSGVVAYDLETDVATTAITRASLASAQGTWTFPWTAEAPAVFEEAMQGADLRVAHNEQFDKGVLAAHSISVPNPTYDTMLAASLLEPDLPKSLASVGGRYLLIKPWKHLSDELGFADPLYSALDSHYTRELAFVLMDKLEDVEMTELFEERMMPSVQVLLDMKTQGIKVDQKITATWCAALEVQLKNDTVRWAVDFPLIKPTSPAQLKKLLYGEWGLPTQRRKGDGITTDELALKTLIGLSPEHKDHLELLLSIREKTKLLSAFGRTLLGKDRVNPSYLPAGKDNTKGHMGKGLAATGRLACSKPNLQQQPKSARKLYVPDEPWMSFVELDWSQAELRVAATLAEDEVMLEALKTDIHKHTMESLGADRRTCKGVTYGTAYGSGPRKLTETLKGDGIDLSVSEARCHQDNLFKTYRKWAGWRHHITDLAKAQGHLRNPFGRVRRFPLDEDIPAALDYIPQSVVADMGWTLYLPVWELARAYGGRLTTVVHDSFVLQLPAEVLEEAIPEFITLLERRFPEVAPGFYIPVDVEVAPAGASWGDMEPWS